MRETKIGKITTYHGNITSILEIQGQSAVIPCTRESMMSHLRNQGCELFDRRVDDEKEELFYRWVETAK